MSVKKKLLKLAVKHGLISKPKAAKMTAKHYLKRAKKLLGL